MTIAYLAVAGFCVGGMLTTIGGLRVGMCIIGALFLLTFALRSEYVDEESTTKR